MQKHCKKYVKQLELRKNKPRITYLFRVADIFLLLVYYHNIFCFFTINLLSDAIFVLPAGQKTISPGHIVFMSPCLSVITLIKAQECDNIY